MRPISADEVAALAGIELDARASKLKSRSVTAAEIRAVIAGVELDAPRRQVKVAPRPRKRIRKRPPQPELRAVVRNEEEDMTWTTTTRAALLFALSGAVMLAIAIMVAAPDVKSAKVADGRTEHWRAMERVAAKFSGEHHLIYQPDGNLLPKILPFTSDAVENCIAGGFDTADLCLERQGWRFVEKTAHP